MTLERILRPERLPCPNFIPTEQNLPILNRQRDNLIEISVCGERLLPPQRRQEIDDAVRILEERIAYVSECSEQSYLQPSRPN